MICKNGCGLVKVGVVTHKILAAFYVQVIQNPPFQNAGSTPAFVSELVRLFKAFATSSALDPVAIRAAMVLPILLL